MKVEVKRLGGQTRQMEWGAERDTRIRRRGVICSQYSKDLSENVPRKPGTIGNEQMSILKYSLCMK